MRCYVSSLQLQQLHAVWASQSAAVWAVWAFQRTCLTDVAMGKAQSKTKLSEEDILFLEENTTMNRAKIMVTYENGIV